MDVTRDIAIVGIGGIFPGADNVEQFWTQILAGQSQAREVPAGRWPLSVDAAYDPSTHPPRADKVYSKRGCFVDPFVCDIDGLNISRGQLDCLDPMFHLLLHAGRAAWRDTITGTTARERIGIIIGNIVLPTDASSDITEEILGPLFAEKAIGRHGRDDGRGTDPLNRYVAGLPAAILAKALGVGGTAFTLDAACASSLYAIKLAVEELLSGRADLMLTGGLSRPDCLYTQMGFSQLHALSPSGRCAPFDKHADGLVVGEGAGIIALKRVSDALRDGDRIYATIPAGGIGLSNDIAGNLMQPDSSGQVRAMREAYQQSGWSPRDIDLIECHGTGTPIGDAVEFKSLLQLWQSASIGDNRCVIGSVKSNVGHLLTAAGSAGLIKVLLAMRDGKLPPSANFTESAAGIEMDSSPFDVLREPAEWKRRAEHPRRAAISAFGFGGINAHLLIQEWEPAAASHSVSVPTTVLADAAVPDIAIVGMGAHFGPWENLAACRRRIFGNDLTKPAAPRQWPGAGDGNNYRGFFVDEVRVPLGRFRIPPAELSEMLPQQLLMLQVAADAFDDAGIGLDKNPAERLDTGVFIGIGLDLNTTNFRFRWMLQEKAARWARERNLQLTPAQLDQWIGQLRAAAGPALNANRTMGALGGIVASRIARAFHVGGPSFTISSEETSGLNAMEVGIRALQRHEISVALVGAVDLAGDQRAVLCQEAVRPYDGRPIGEGAAAFILKRHEDAMRDGDRIYAVVPGGGGAASAIAPDVNRAEPAAFDASEFGDAGVATPFASLIKAALALHHETLPPEVVLADNPRQWLRNRVRGLRRASVSATSVVGASSQLILESSSHIPTATVEPGEQVFVLRAAGSAELVTTIATLEQIIESSAASLASLAQQWFREHRSAHRKSVLAVVAESVPRLREQLAEARRAISQNTLIQTGGVYFTHAPLRGQNPAGKIAFVYPGSGTQFPGMGRDLAAVFPQILHQQDAENENLADQFAATQCWFGDADISPRDAIFAHVSLGAFVTDLLAAFALKPQAVIGYSLGESTGLFATRTWRGRDDMLARMHASTLFTTELTGPCDAARRAWKIPAEEKVHWVVGVINRTADVVRRAMQGRRRVYLLIVNTPNECVIGGDESCVNKFVCDLDAVFHPVTDVTTVHCEIAAQVEAAYRELHLLDATPPEGVRFYSGALGASYDVTRESAAESIVRQAIAPFDFTKVIRAAYADGIRFFVEVGPGATCTRMIDQILADQPHVARSACVSGQNNVSTLLSLLALLISEGVEIDLVPWFAIEHCEAPTSNAPSISVRTGSGPFQVPPPPKPEEEIAPSRPQIREPDWLANEVSIGVMDLHPILQQMTATQIAHAQAQEAFLRISENNTRAISSALSFQMSMLSGAGAALLEAPSPERDSNISYAAPAEAPRTLEFPACMEFAVGSIGKVLGSAFAHVDAYPTRVRLPDKPLMLAHRITSIDAIPNALLQKPSAGGRLSTEHDIVAGAWYLDANRIPTCIAVEAGQADLFLSGYLGIDSITKGRAVYRLLDAVVTFHGPLPAPGTTIVYDIAIEHFFRQGDTHLFRFHFEATVNGRPFLSMTKGCAGFFTEGELAAGKGIVLTTIDKRPLPGKRPADWIAPVPMAVESYSDDQVAALRNGNLAGCFGQRFKNLVSDPATIPGAGHGPRGRMKLVHRILKLDPLGGRFSIGQITGEADIRPDDWFLTCHFVDDRVMPGTLMYECCLHTLRVYLLRMGWVGNNGEVAYEPITGIASQLKCRGQVTAATKKVQYEVTLKEIGYQSDGTPFVVADALMYADGRPIVQMLDMSTQLTGLKKQRIDQLWRAASLPTVENQKAKTEGPLFDTARITAFALGKPSDAFGEPYKIFDPGQPRKIARLPGPPYQFLDRVTRIENCQPFKLAAGGMIEAEYDVPPDEWYFRANQQNNISEMPFSVLLEIALQPCGWLAAYLGSALTSITDLKFRNLGGSAVQLRPVLPNVGTLTTAVKITKVSNSGGMIIQHFDMAVRCRDGEVYKGNTYFGFFSREALANQVGIRDAAIYQPTPDEIRRGQAFAYPEAAPFPNRQMRMVDRVTHFDPGGGPKQLGFIRGTTTVNPDAWFFKAHFFEDPVWPGSLGLESFIQLLKMAAHRRWVKDTPPDSIQFQTLARNEKHSWIYRGQIIPTDKLVTIDAAITHIDDSNKLLRADGFLTVDNRVIYQMKDFTVSIAR